MVTPCPEYPSVEDRREHEAALVLVEFSKMPDGCTADCSREWLPADCERPLDARKNRAYSYYSLILPKLKCKCPN
jgi:hypothetical protein